MELGLKTLHFQVDLPLSVCIFQGLQLALKIKSLYLDNCQLLQDVHESL